jgi:hypothetical protein
MMPYWISETLATTPAFAFVYLVLGGVWALALLPRSDWRKPAHVLALAFLLGPALLTAWMLLLGVVGAQSETRLLRADTVLAGVVMMTVIGAGWAWRRGISPQPSAISPQPIANSQKPKANSLKFDERLLIALMAIALVVRWFVAAYWPFIAYDTLWVYGYQGRLYTLLGYIPNSIDYYPQFLSLQYTFGQLIYGGVNDHAARAVIPFINLGTTLAAYVLGDRLFGRRVGIYAAAVWTLYHHVGEWSRMGDLEIALTASFTLAAAYFLSAVGKLNPRDTEGAEGKGVLGIGYWVSGVRNALRDSSGWLRLALLAGLALGVALWTKPTAGAFVWGMGAVAVGYWVLGRGNREQPSAISHQPSTINLEPTANSQNPKPKAQNSSLVTHYSSLSLALCALVTLLAAFPLGGVWYIRNLLLGHEIVRFPGAFWLTQAQQSGAEFGWVLLAMGLWTGYMLLGGLGYRVLGRGDQRQSNSSDGFQGMLSLTDPRWTILTGLGMALYGAWDTILVPARMILGELLMVAGGIVVWLWGIIRFYRQDMGTTEAQRMQRGEGIAFSQSPTANRQKPTSNTQSLSLLFAFLLATPYFITWFVSYSYHYRLSFAIVPLLIVPSAWVLAWVGTLLSSGFGVRPQAGTTHGTRRILHFALCTLIIALSLPGIVIPLYDGATGWDGLWSGELADDRAKQESGNAALMNVVQGLQIYLDEHDTPMRVIAPGVETLPFFFPLEDIRVDEAPTQLDALDGITYFIDSHPQGTGRYEQVALTENAVLGALARQDIMRRAWGMDDGIFRYNVYELFTEQRFVPPQPSDAAMQEVRFGEYARILGNDIGGFEFWVGRPIYLTLYWQVLAQTEADYSVYIHLRDSDGNLLANWDAPIAYNPANMPPRYYSTRVWQAGEYITDVRVLRLTEELPLAEGLSLVVGLYDPQDGTRVPMWMEDTAIEGGYLVDDRFSIIASPEG